LSLAGRSAERPAPEAIVSAASRKIIGRVEEAQRQIWHGSLWAGCHGTPNANCRSEREEDMLFLILLVILLLVVAPTWPYSRGWGYYPSGGLATVLVILVVLMLLGYVHL